MLRPSSATTYAWAADSPIGCRDGSEYVPRHFGYETPAVSEVIVFVFAAKCPGCRYEHPQNGFTVASLQRLLMRDHPIEGYCVICDEFWQISNQERARVAVDLPGFASMVSRRLTPSWVS